MLFKNNTYLLVCLALFIGLINIQCSENEMTDDTYFGSKVMILGHRGMGVYYRIPGDTYESIEPAIGIGSDGCEIDLQLTKDSVLVLYHNPELNSSTTCTGRIYESNFKEIKECKYIGLENMVFVCSIDEVFSKLPNIENYYFSFDCKIDDQVSDHQLYISQFIRAIKRLCDKFNMSDNVFIEGNTYFLNIVKSMGLTNKLFLSGTVDESTIEIADSNSYFGIVTQIVDNSVETKTDLAHSKGLYIMGYSPYNYYQNTSAIRKKVDILQTDDPISILKLFHRFNYEYVIP
ncbi:MAG: hypothetical protein HXX09_14625 [Bacteroidetes bacterium]|nr:hypothetical protein [Bacteroidota bacterium]